MTQKSELIMFTPEIINEIMEEAILDQPMEESEIDVKPVSIWIKDNDIFRPSTNVLLMELLDPGLYSVNMNREYGLFCRKLDAKYDELYIFKDFIINSIMNEIDEFWKKKDVYKKNNILHKRGILLEGYPGVGKTSIISLLCKDVINRGGVVFKVNGYRNLQDYIEFLHHSFRKIQPETPVITIIEDIDQYEEVNDELLDFLDGKTSINHHVVVATSNNTENLPDTYLRTSRLDLKVEIPPPTKEIRKEFFIKKNVDETILQELVTKSDNFSFSDLKELYICVCILGYPINDAITRISNPREKKNYLNRPKKTTKLSL